MKYFATIAGRERTVEIESAGANSFRLRIDDGPFEVVNASRLEGSTISLLRGETSEEIDLEEDGEALNVLVQDELLRLELVDERKKRLARAGGKSAVEGKVVVKAPMPGKVVKVLVQPGAQVTEGQGLVIIEAMKMENELRSPRAGTVSAVKVKEGQTVEGKAELVSVE